MKKFLERTISLILVCALLLTSAPWAYAAEQPDPVEELLELLTVDTEPAEEEAEPEEEEIPEEAPDLELQAEQQTSDGYFYTTDGKTVTITGCNNDDLVLTIPAEIDGLPVTTIGKKAFYDRDGLHEVILPQGVTTLELSAFAHCDGLRKVTIPDTLTNIKISPSPSSYIGPFLNCGALEEVVFTGTPTSIPYHLLEGTGITELTVPASVTSIENYALRGCAKLTTLTIHGNVTSIGQNAFENCSSLEEIHFADSYETLVIGREAFRGCDALTEVVLPQGLTRLYDQVFAHCDNLAAVTVPDTLSSIVMNTNPSQFGGPFVDCAALKTVSFSGTPTWIADHLLEGSGIETVTIPDSVTVIGNYAFRGCSELSKISIPASVTEIRQFAFQNCGALETIDFADSYEKLTISSYVFQNCDSLTEVVLPRGLTKLNEYSFSNCGSLTRAVLPEGMTDLDRSIFDGVSGLSVNIPTTLTGCNYVGPFAGCTLTEITFAEGIETLPSYLFKNATMPAEIVIPDTVTAMGDYIFEKAHGLTSVVLPDGLKEIPSHAFYYAEELASVKLPANLVRIRDYAFDSIAATEMKFPDTLKRIDEYAFSNCEGLTEIILPEGLEILEFRAFGYIESPLTVHLPTTLTAHNYAGAAFADSVIEQIVFPEGIEYLAPHLFGWATLPAELTIPETVTAMGEYVFERSKGLNSVVLPDGMKEIPSHAFYYAADLASVKLPANLERIHDYAFDSIAVTEIDLPDTLKRIDEYAFSGCSGLTKIILPEGLEVMETRAFGHIGTPLTVHLPTTLISHNYSGAAFSNSVIEQIVFPEGIKYLAPHLFAWATLPAEIVIPDTVTAMGDYIFEKATGLTSIVLPDGMQEIPSHAFYFAEELASVKLPANLERIRDYAFDSIAATEMKFPATLKHIDESAFSNCEGLTEIILPEGLEVMETRAFGHIGTPLTVHLPTTLISHNYSGAAFSNSVIEQIVFPEGIAYLAPHLFAWAALPAEIVIPDTVTAMGDYIFEKATGLKSIVLPDGMKEIPSHAFYFAEELASVKLPANLERIRNYAFDSIAITDIEFPATLKRIDESAFSGCGGLTEISLPSSVNYIGNGAFAYNKNLTTLSCSAENIQIDGWPFRSTPNVTVICSDRSELAVHIIEEEKRPLSLYPSATPRTNLVDHSDYLINTATAIGGNYLTFTVKYGFKDPAEARWAQVDLLLPENTLLVDNTVRVNGEAVTYEEENGFLSVPVPTEGGRVELSVRILGSGDLQSFARIRSALGTELVRVVSEPLPEVTISVPERTNIDTVTVTGLAHSGATVDLYVDDQLKKTVTANKAGSYSAALTLPVKDPDKYQIFDIRAESGEGYARSQLRYSKDNPELVEFLMYYNNHQDTCLDLLAARETRPHLQFNPAYAITLTAKFENGDKIDKVWFTSSRGGAVRTIPAELIDGKYVAVMTREDYNGTPGTLAVEYSLKRDTLYVDKAVQDLQPAIDAAKDLIQTDDVTVRPLDETEVEIPDGLILDEAQEVTVDLGQALSLPTAMSSILRVEKFHYNQNSSNSAAGILNTGVTITDTGVSIPDTSVSIMTGMVGMSACFRSGSAPLKPYTPAASSTDGYQRFTVQDKAGNKYNIAYKASGSASDEDPVGDYICLVEDVSNNEVFKFVVESAFNNTDEIAEALENAGAFYEAVGVVYDLYQIEKESKELENAIRQRYHGAEQEEALKKAKELKSNRQDFTLAMAVIGGGLAAAGMMTGPAGWGMMALLFAMSASSEFFWENRTNNILGGTFGAEYIIDPSGYVYEAVTTNRLAGVTTTAYWIPEPADADLDAFYAEKPLATEMGQVWDAEEYGQVNPLITGSDGAYAWDVPAGWWRVLYEKDGYETTYSDWLPVPPPQLEVNIPMVDDSAPVLESVVAETGRVEVTFSKYMQPETVALSLGGSAMEASWSTAETAADGTVYARTFVLTPETPLTEDSVITVSVAEGALSYAGTAAAAGSMEARVGGAPRLEIRSHAQVQRGTTAQIPFTVKNAELPVVTAVSGQPAMLTAEVSLNAGGSGILKLSGLLPGTATVTLSLNGTEVCKALEVEVVSVPVEQVVNSLSDPSYDGSSATVTVTCDRSAQVVATVYGEQGQYLDMVCVPVEPCENEPVTVDSIPAGSKVILLLLDEAFAPLCEKFPVK